MSIRLHPLSHTQKKETTFWEKYLFMFSDERLARHIFS